ncbi:MAG: hypothetical protein GY936_00115 [Ignavibacteriae bacterium]|nr:hypothetical protein [Ignavibacteriota bacterium]
MRYEIIEVLNEYVCCLSTDDDGAQELAIMPESIDDIAKEIEKLFESHIKTGVVEVLNDSDN